ncbi:MAG: polysaccharide biosynthesis [Rhodospirillales bacterium]|jgi:protein involved in polysaccharide export with SLBB domain|nr:polysaccharide biosynthesis [Rhodospirillales bacterium]
MRLKVLAAFAACIGFALTGCMGGGGGSLPPLPQTAASESAYRLGPGDKLKINVFGSEDLSGDFAVGDTGMLSLPLIGDIKAVGLTPDQLSNAMKAKLADGFMRDPKVSISVTSYRPVYVMGEVTRPGEYPFASGMSVLNAIALGGGYSYRANQEYAIVTRDNREYRASGTSRIAAGDIVRIPERYF